MGLNGLLAYSTLCTLDSDKDRVSMIPKIYRHKHTGKAPRASYLYYTVFT